MIMASLLDMEVLNRSEKKFNNCVIEFDERSQQMEITIWNSENDAASYILFTDELSELALFVSQLNIKISDD
jgi:hypothetical protein